MKTLARLIGAVTVAYLLSQSVKLGLLGALMYFAGNVDGKLTIWFLLFNAKIITVRKTDEKQ